jgi:adenylate cyclase
MRLRTMAHLDDQSTRAARGRLEALVTKTAEDWAELAHVLMIDHLRSWNGATQENIGLAEKHLKKAYAINRSVPLAHVAEGQIREAKGHLQGAIGALNKALQLDPHLAIAYAHKANALILLGRAKKAPELLAKAISSGDPDPGLCYWFMGRAYFNMKNYPNAIWWLKKSVHVRPATWFSWAHLISAYALTKQLKGQDAKRALDKYRLRFKATWPLANIKDYYKQKKYKNAPRELQDALDKYLKGLKKAKQDARFP